jgi:MFS superfamily sulfate permease-like transporter
MVDHVLVVLFDNDIFFANAGVFRREVHQIIKQYPTTRHFVIDAVAVSDVDVTGLATLGQVVDDISKDKVSVSFARASDKVKATLAKSGDPLVRGISFYDSVDAAVLAATSTE